MCEFNLESEARKLTQFIVEHAGTMGEDSIARAVHESLTALFPDTEGTSLVEVHSHITDHMLHPSVRIGSILRSLLDLSNKISASCSAVDECGNVIIDAKNVHTYLKVVNEIKQIYAIVHNHRLMFTESVAGNGQMRVTNVSNDS